MLSRENMTLLFLFTWYKLIYRSHLVYTYISMRAGRGRRLYEPVVENGKDRTACGVSSFGSCGCHCARCSQVDATSLTCWEMRVICLRPDPLMPILSSHPSICFSCWVELFLWRKINKYWRIVKYHDRL